MIVKGDHTNVFKALIRLVKILHLKLDLTKYLFTVLKLLPANLRLISTTYAEISVLPVIHWLFDTSFRIA